ncbi:short-chain dehydrogenase [Mycolicibacter terrae]|uniref:Short-chain dehydrogenase n=1 Tax=Mycolicibacter terrae TaxID=1788 RepID=A0AAD1HUV8_9MYCO|nr:SDR family NAD(P)-dependent oxidoreductase [Mycolicibacter terrae]ORW90875.1 short-chain dehydrogenase [Mycolicibacter terrae]BBX21275.1 short-chain dehydrogenase [Mycolicibacter terrae]SNV90555.1 short-chain dehydrogenase/reductase SDR [Mycolicibacter terrae]
MTVDVGKYGPWALIVGASDGVGAAFAEALAQGGLNVLLVARRRQLLAEVATGIAQRHGVQTRTVAVDLTEPGAANTVIDTASDLDIGFLVYCAGADPDFKPFLDNSITAAEAMVQRNCVVPMQLCHALAPAMVQRGAGAIVILGSGAGFVGGPNMVAYGASKAFDMVFAEALWCELRDTGVDVIGLILGKTDTPALRRLEHERGQIGSTEQVPPGAAPVERAVATALNNLSNGPTVYVGDEITGAAQLFASMGRNESVAFMAQAISAAMGK